MKYTTVKLSQTENLGEYCSTSAELEFVLEDGDDFNECVKTANAQLKAIIALTPKKGAKAPAVPVQAPEVNVDVKPMATATPVAAPAAPAPVKEKDVTLILRENNFEAHTKKHPFFLQNCKIHMFTEKEANGKEVDSKKLTCKESMKDAVIAELLRVTELNNQKRIAEKKRAWDIHIFEQKAYGEIQIYPVEKK